MDVYHKVLIKLYEVTGGKESESVDLKDLVKKAGFLGAYNDIFQHLSRQSWISETPRPDTVKITHWGIKEARQSHITTDAGPNYAVKKEINLIIADTRELNIFFEELAADPTSDNLAKAEKKLAQINSAIQKLKTSVQ
jgi:hypothetical protein